MSNQVYPGIKYQVQESIFDAKSMLDETNFYHQRQGSPSELTKKLTYILGDYNKSFPISTMTMGGVGYGNSRSAIEIDDVQFTYPVMGRDNKASIVYDSLYVAGDKPGLGNQPFYLIFGDNWIKRFYTIQSERGIQAYVLEDGEPLPTGGYRYKCQLNPAGPLDACPVDQTAQGTKWIELFTSVAESESRTTDSKMVMPGLFKNQMSFMRTGMSWAGNAANKFMKIKIQTDKGETDVWMDYFMWQFEKRWMEDCEHFYWYSRYNRLSDGTIPLKDLYTGKVVPTGSGLLEQIANKSTYSKLTYNTIANKVGDALFGQNDSGNMSLTLMTGTGGMREFDRAMKDAGATVLGPLGAGDIASKFVTGTGRNLALGGFFDTFYHIDGYTIKVKLNQTFNTGRVALASPLHPESGLPLESYRMVFLDDSDVDGQPNIQHVAQKGRSYIDGMIKGLTPTPRSVNLAVGNSGGEGNKILSTDQDKSAYVRMKSAGIQILRANRCFDMQCVAGL
jgi:hypothetical protein